MPPAPRVVERVSMRVPIAAPIAPAVPSPENPVEIATPSGPMALVEGGRFRMGYRAGRANEQPEHLVAVHSFYLDRYEVTVARYRNVLPGSVPDRMRLAPSDTPAMHITWYQAERFCRTIGQRLPREAEWEYAARGVAGSTYPWGNRLRPEAANVQGTYAAFAPIARVGSFAEDVSWAGIYDMLGNAPEWVADDYQPYDGLRRRGWPAGRKTVRGAGITYTEDETRLTVRDSAPDRRGLIGFRCASDLPVAEGRGLKLIDK